MSCPMSSSQNDKRHQNTIMKSHFDERSLLPCGLHFNLNVSLKWEVVQGKPTSTVTRHSCVKKLASHQDALLDLKYTVEQESLEETEVGGRRWKEGEKEWWLLWSFGGPIWIKKEGLGGGGRGVSKSLFLNLKQNVSNSTRQNWNWFFLFFLFLRGLHFSFPGGAWSSDNRRCSVKNDQLLLLSYI